MKVIITAETGEPLKVEYETRPVSIKFRDPSSLPLYIDVPSDQYDKLVGELSEYVYGVSGRRGGVYEHIEEGRRRPLALCFDDVLYIR